MEQEQYELRVLWGSFWLNGDWHPNPHLSMSAEAQHLANQLTLLKIQNNQTVAEESWPRQ